MEPWSLLLALSSEGHTVGLSTTRSRTSSLQSSVTQPPSKGPRGLGTHRLRLSIELVEQEARVSSPLLMLLGQQGLPASAAVLQGGEPEAGGGQQGQAWSWPQAHALAGDSGVPCIIHRPLPDFPVQLLVIVVRSRPSGGLSLPASPRDLSWQVMGGWL